MTALKAGWKNCTHHFVHPSPNGKFSFGKCKKCGKVDKSRNSLEYQGWNTKKMGEFKNHKKESK